MRNSVKRVLLFFLATPALLAAVFFLPQANHLTFNIIVTAAAGLAGMEVIAMFRASRLRASARPALGFVAAAVLPAAATAATLTGGGGELVPAAGVATAGAFLGGAAITAKDGHFEAVLPNLAAYFFALAYPGLFALHGVQMTTLPFPSVLIVVFLCSVFLNDSLAYVAGMLFGRNSRPLLAVSPNKSLAGFAGGFLASVLVIVVAGLLAPELFPGTTISHVAFGSVLGLVTILGDLAESALKRAATVKDSGTLIPGRGGILDSADSPLFVAPVFYYLYMIIFLG
ncbi:MAG: phosphatidate cytidylyltransferase [Spirochaetaceae bacterium]